MGVDADGARILLGLVNAGAARDSLLTIGRMQLFAKPSSLLSMVQEYSFAKGGASFANGAYAEEFFSLLGFKQTHSLDISDFEGCTFVHDMNLPIPEHFKNYYDVVFDGGTLEHVYNFPMALENCLAMVKGGGHFVTIGPANNCCGHGFYQFSPELYYTALRAAGFVVREMIMIERRGRQTRWYSVANPSILQSRINLHNRYPVYLSVVAQKGGECGERARAPQQSDYVAAWENAPVTSQSSGWPSRIRSLLYRLVPSLGSRCELAYHQHWISSFRNRRVYTPIEQRGFVVRRFIGCHYIRACALLRYASLKLINHPCHV